MTRKGGGRTVFGHFLGVAAAICKPPQDPRPRYASGRLKPTAAKLAEKAKGQRVRRAADGGAADRARYAAHKEAGTGRWSPEAKARERARDAAHKEAGTGRWSPEAKARESTPEFKAHRSARRKALKVSSMENFIKATHGNMKSGHKRRKLKGVCMDFAEAWADFLEQCPQDADGRSICTRGDDAGAPFDLRNKLDWPSPDRIHIDRGYEKGECTACPPFALPSPRPGTHPGSPSGP